MVLAAQLGKAPCRLWRTRTEMGGVVLPMDEVDTRMAAVVVIRETMIDLFLAPRRTMQGRTVARPGMAPVLLD